MNLFLDKAEARLLENPVAVNLWNRYKDKVYYLKSQNFDVDFFVEKTGEVIQAAFSVSDVSYDRETKALIQAAAAVKKAKKFFIITYDEEKELNVNGIKITVMSIWEWLIEN